MKYSRENTASTARAASKCDSLREGLNVSFQKGRQLCVEKRFDYAHELLAQCVMKDPNNVPFVEAMLENLRIKFGGNKKSIPLVSRLGRGRALNKAIRSKHWQGALQLGIDQLKVNPWHVPTLRSLAEMCAVQHHNEAELVYLKQALDAEPKNVDVNRHCAQSLGRMGQFDQAIACWHRVETLKCKDDEATKNISFLAQQRLRYPSGRPPTIQAKQVSVATPELEENLVEDVVLSARQKLEQAIANDRANPANYLELAAILVESHQWNAGENLLKRAIAACGEQATLKDMLNRIYFLRAEEQRQTANELATNIEANSLAVRVPWLEIALAFAIGFLSLQLFPRVWEAAESMVDFRRWSSSSWFLLNFTIVIGLILFRFRSALLIVKGRKRVRHKHRLAHERA